VLTFSDHEIEVNSNFEGNIVCHRPRRHRQFADGCSGSFHLKRKSSNGYELQQSIGEDYLSDLSQRQLQPSK